MKKNNIIVSMILALSLIAGTVATVAAFDYKYPESAGITVNKLESVMRTYDTAEGTTVTPDALDKSVSQELTVEKVAYQFNKEVVEGKYKLVSTDELSGWIKDGNQGLIVDTMGVTIPAYKQGHIKGAFEAWAPLTGGSWTEDYSKADFVKKIADELKAQGKTVKKTYYWNTKTKKWTTTKPAKKYWGKCTKKGDAHKGNKSYTVTVVNKNAKVVVYCGFVGCGRSHEGAKALVEAGYKNVYRYGGGLSAWFDAAQNNADAYPIEKSVANN